MKHIFLLFAFLLAAPIWAAPKNAADETKFLLNLRRAGFFQLQGQTGQYDASGNLKINCIIGCSASAGFTDNTAFTVGTSAITNIGAYFTSGADPACATGNACRLRADASSNLKVNCAVGCSGSSFADNGAFTAGTTAIGITGGWYSTSPTACTSGSACAPSLTSDRKLFVQDFQGTSPWVVSLASTTVTGTVAVTQSTSPWVDNLTQVASTALGATAVVNYGSTPAAVAVPAVNAFITNTPTVTANAGTGPSTAWKVDLSATGANATAIKVDGSAVTQPVSGTVTANAGTGTFTVGGTVTANQGTPNSAANSWPVEQTDGTNILGTSTHPTRVDPTGTTTQPVSGTVTANEGGTWTNRVVGNAGAAMDAAFAASPAANGIQPAHLAITALPTAVANAQDVQPASDKFGRTVVLANTVRDLVKMASVQTTNNTQTALLAAQGTGIFADLISLTVTSESSTACTISLTDGTTTYKINVANTQGSGITWNPATAVPAASANVAWNVTGCTSVTLDYIGEFALNK